MIGSLASFIAMAVASRELSSNLSTFQILFFRSVVGVFVIAVLARRLWPEMRHLRSLPLNALRNVVHFSAQYCWTLGVALLPLTEVFALEFTMPVWVAIFAFLILGEPLTRPRIAAIAVSFLGVMLILRPGVEVLDPASFIVLLAAAGYGMSAVLVKRLTRTNTPGVIVAWMVLMQLPMGLVFATFDWRPVEAGNLPWIILAGLCGLSAHFTMARAFQTLDVSVAIPIDFLRVPLIAIVGYLLYGETVGPWLLVGVAMILSANYFALRAEGRRARLAKAVSGPG
ncbi:DMT family transporter [Paracoccus aurantiacus]|uniref:DMT family transporter n=2 Tax=Paracoccus aurantiacus TaxID=2599412 RepID=A0A5C6S1N9_9RHOB|nr:DMT family transporter [Paracoccus aurantiacus]